MGKKIKFIKGLCHGVFDIIHIGHLKHFNEAKKYCNYLIVSITSDRFVRKSKGPKKPIFNQDERFKILSSLKIVDEVIITDCETAEECPLHLEIEGLPYSSGMTVKQLKTCDAPLKKSELELE